MADIMLDVQTPASDSVNVKLETDVFCIANLLKNQSSSNKGYQLASLYHLAPHSGAIDNMIVDLASQPDV